MQLLEEINRTIAHKTLPDVRSGDTVRVHLRIREGNKERVQVFEGLVIRRRGGNGPAASVTVRRIASGVGTERVFQLHSPRIVRLQITKRSKVRRAYLTYIRGRRGKASRLQEKRFDRVDMNMEAVAAQPAPAAEAEVPGNDPVGPEDDVPVADSPEEVSEAAPPEMPSPESENAESAASAGDSDTVSDAEVTEIATDSAAADEPAAEDVVSTEEMVQDENRAAAKDARATTSDENEVFSDAVAEGVEEAATESGSSPAQRVDEADAETAHSSLSEEAALTSESKTRAAREAEVKDDPTP
jgi:large subunit ribosomal protein L19